MKLSSSPLAVFFELECGQRARYHVETGNGAKQVFLDKASGRWQCSCEANALGKDCRHISAAVRARYSK